jgi:O-antigen ligase
MTAITSTGNLRRGSNSFPAVLLKLANCNSIAGIILLPIGATLTKVSWSEPFLMYTDLVFAIAVAILVLRVFAGSAPRSALFNVGIVFVVAQSISFAVHPSDVGVVRLLRIVGVLSFVESFAALTPGLRRAAERALVAVGVFEVGLLGLQRIVGRAILPGVLEYRRHTWAFGSTLPLGSFPHQYVLSAFGMLIGTVCVLGIFRSTMSIRWALAGIGTAGYLGCATSGRSSTLTIVILGVVLLVGGLVRKKIRSEVALAVIVLVSAGSIGYLSALSEWQSRKATSNVAASNSMRIDLLNQSIKLWERSPIVGVGPGRYHAGVLEHPELVLADTDLPVHNVGLLFLAETGLVGLLGALGFLGLLAKRARRVPLLDLLPAVAFVPYLLFDVMHVVLPDSVLQLAVLIGFFAYRVEPQAEAHVRTSEPVREH